MNVMAKPARVRETVNVRAIYNFHPLFASTRFDEYNTDEGRIHSTIEGGDIHVIGNGAVLIGMGRERRRWRSSCSLRLFSHRARRPR